ncbi:MAG TPA: GAF domain-containing protein, partial [Armatimonadota bacterium]
MPRKPRMSETGPPGQDVTPEWQVIWSHAVEQLSQVSLEAQSSGDLEYGLVSLLSRIPVLLTCDAALLAICSREAPSFVKVWGATRTRHGEGRARLVKACLIEPGGQAERLISGETGGFLGPEDQVGLLRPDGTSAVLALFPEDQRVGPLEILALPLSHRDKPLGLFIAGRRPRPNAEPWPTDRVDLVLRRSVGVIAQLRLLEEMELRERETWALYRVTEAVSASFDLNEVLQTVLQESMTLFMADAGALLMMEMGGTQPLTALAGHSDVFLRFFRDGRHSGLLGSMMATGQPLWTGNWPEHPDAGDELERAAVRASGLHSVLCVPLRYRGVVCGTLSVAFREPLAFRPRHVESLSNLARQAAVAIDNFRLLDSLMRRAFELSAIQEVGAAVMGQQPLEGFLTLVARKAAELASVENGAVCFLTPQGKGLVVVAATGPAAEQCHGVSLSLEDLPGGVSLSRGEALYLDDLSSLYLSAPQAGLLPGIRSLLAIPLRIQEEVLGSLLLFRSEEEPFFNEGHVEVLQLFASQASIAIENARLLQSVSSAKAEWESTFDSISDQVVLLDQQGLIARCNQAFARWAGVPVAQLIGRKASQLFQEVGGCELPNEVLTAGETALREVEMPKLGRIHLMTSSPLYDGAGLPRGSVHISKDVTEQRRLQEQLGESEKLRALGEMAGGVAHDFNNLLTGILGNAQLALRDPAVPDVVYNHLRVIEAAALDGAETVKRLQTFSKRRPGGKYQLLSLSDAALDALEMTKPRWRDEAQAQGIRIEVSTSLPSLPRVSGNPAEIREVITNLIINAVQAMPEGGMIDVRSWQQGDWAWLAVKDTGGGMPPDVLKRVFEPFFTTKGEEGTGLGLSVSHGIVRQHGGDAFAESKPGQGSTFYIRLPLHKGSVAPEQVADVPAPEVLCNILAVDDQESVRQIIGNMLRAAGHNVSLAASGKEALAFLQRNLPGPEGNRIDLVITDLGMPHMTGSELATRIRSRHPEVPIVLLTGWGGLPGERNVEESVDMMLSKPIDLDELLSAIQGLVQET